MQWPQHAELQVNGMQLDVFPSHWMMHGWHLQCNGVSHCQLSFLLSPFFSLVWEGAHLLFWELQSVTITLKSFTIC